MSVDSSDVLRNLREFKTRLPEMEYKCLEKACLKVESDGKQKCNVNTGLMRDSITHVIEETASGLAGYVGTNLEQAVYVHQGTGIYALEGNGRKEVPWHYKDAKGNWHTTSGIKPNPFLQNAVDDNRESILNYFKGMLDDA